MAYISVTDAVARTGKGSTTIHRLCRKHEHTKFVKREENKFLIDEDFLIKHYSEANNEQNKAENESQSELIDIYIEELLKEKAYYRKMLEAKDEQLVRQDRIISNLQERQRELHHLLHHQTQLLDGYRNPEPEDQPDAKPNPRKKTSSSEEVKLQKTGAQYPPMDQAKIVYAVLAAVGLLLLLAIIFVDEIRSLVENGS